MLASQKTENSQSMSDTLKETDKIDTSELSLNSIKRLDLDQNLVGLVKENQEKQCVGKNKWSKNIEIKDIKFFLPTVVIDLSFENYMVKKQLCSLAAQIAYSYSAIKKSNRPLKLVLTSLIPNSLTEQILHTHDGYAIWKLVKESKSVDELYDKSRLIYLSPESPNIIENISFEKIYVIGGIVDNNQLKGLSLDRANKLGIQSAKFRIKSSIPQFSNQSLNINHIVEILVSAAETNDLDKAFKTYVPIRYQRFKPKWSFTKSKNLEESEKKEDQNLKNNAYFGTNSTL